METTVMIGQYVGPTMVVMAIALICNTKSFIKLIEVMEKERLAMLLTGMMSFILGIGIILHSNIWILGWEGVITLIGWAALIKGAGYLICPKFFSKTGKKVTSKKLFKIVGIIYAIIGLWICYNVFM